MSDEKIAALETAKAGLTTAKEAYKSFLKKNNLKDGATPKDENLAKKMASYQSKIEKAEKAIKAAKKDLKPKKEKAERVSKYDYPADVTTAEDKKKFRTAQRNAAKSAAKAEKKGDKKKSAKAEVEAPVKKKKKAVAVESED